MVRDRHLIHQTQISAKLTISVDPMSTLYEQLADALAQRINDGSLQPGERLPSVRQACAQAHVSVDANRKLTIF